MITEAEVTYQITIMMDMFFTGISILFTVISAYIVGLYWFIRHTRIYLKLVAFGFLTFTLGLITINGVGAFRHMLSLNRALADIQEQQELSVIGQMAIEPVAGDIYDITAMGVGILAFLIYLGLFYLTFLHRWHDNPH